jgi:uncharacterized membrane protein HdeD (DUF308 family)
MNKQLNSQSRDLAESDDETEAYFRYEERARKKRMDKTYRIVGAAMIILGVICLQVCVSTGVSSCTGIMRILMMGAFMIVPGLICLIVGAKFGDKFFSITN